MARRKQAGRLRVLDFEAENLRCAQRAAEERKQDVVAQVADLLNQIPDIAGFVLVAWDFQGRVAVRGRTHESSPIPGNVVPSVVHDFLLRGQAENDTLDTLYGQDPDEGA